MASCEARQGGSIPPTSCSQRADLAHQNPLAGGKGGWLSRRRVVKVLQSMKAKSCMGRQVYPGPFWEKGHLVASSFPANHCEVSRNSVTLVLLQSSAGMK